MSGKPSSAATAFASSIAARRVHFTTVGLAALSQIPSPGARSALSRGEFTL